MARNVSKRDSGKSTVTIVGNYGKAGKAEVKDLEMSTYDKAYHYMDNGTPKEGGVKRKAKKIKSNAKGTLGSKNSRKRS